MLIVEPHPDLPVLKVSKISLERGPGSTTPDERLYLPVLGNRTDPDIRGRQFVSQRLPVHKDDGNHRELRCDARRLLLPDLYAAQQHDHPGE
jgi:hypothetical protein